MWLLWKLVLAWLLQPYLCLPFGGVFFFARRRRVHGFSSKERGEKESSTTLLLNASWDAGVDRRAIEETNPEQ